MTGCLRCSRSLEIAEALEIAEDFTTELAELTERKIHFSACAANSVVKTVRCLNCLPYLFSVRRHQRAACALPGEEGEAMEKTEEFTTELAELAEQKT